MSVAQPPPLPSYYTRLRPFAGALARGRSALTYHKLGPRPPRTRLKGLYLSRRLFEVQLGELQAAGVQPAEVADLAAGAGAGPRPPAMAITFDDGFENVLRHGVEPLARAGFRAIQFLVADRLGQTNEWEQAEGEASERLMDAGQVREWLAAGHDIGAHSRTHPHLSRIPRDRAREEIAGAKKKLEDLFGRPIRHFCYPYGDWDPAVRDLAGDAGYATGCTTEPGVNLPGADPLTLRRFTARYASRNRRWLRDTMLGWLGLGGARG